MNILITGISGFIGSALKRHLKEYYSVYGVSKSASSDERMFCLDLMSERDVQDFIASDNNPVKIDVLIHLASKTASPDKIKDISILESNARITANTILLAQYFKVDHFIHFSSSSVYPNIDGTYSETSTVDPSPNNDCFYGLSKWNSEVMINYLLGNSGMKITHLRCAMVFGEEMPEGRIYPTIRRELKTTGKVTLFGNGERIINFIFVKDLLVYVTACMENQWEGVYNISQHSETMLQFTERVIELENIKNAQIELLPQGNQFKFIMDNSKLKKTLIAR